MPVGLALFEERPHAFVEVLRQIAGEDQILQVLGRHGGDVTADRFLDGGHRERRVLGDPRGQIARAPFERGEGMDLVHQPQRLGLRRRDQPGRQDHLAGADRPDGGDHEGQAGRRREVAQRACDGRAEARVLGGQPQVAGQGHEQAAAHGVALDHGDARVQSAEGLVHMASLVGTNDVRWGCPVPPEVVRSPPWRSRRAFTASTRRSSTGT